MSYPPSDQAYGLDDRRLVPLELLLAGAPQRMARLKALGLEQGRMQALDDFARTVANEAKPLTKGVTPFAMVNFVAYDQSLGGLYVPDSAGIKDLPDTITQAVPLDTGYCPHVVARQKALVLHDVLDYPRFAGNPIVDKLNVRTYVGAPLVDHTGTTLGTICIVNSEPYEWGNPGLAFIKEKATELVAFLERKQGVTE